MKKGKLNRRFLIDKKEESSKNSNLMKPKPWIKSYGDYEICETDELFINNNNNNKNLKENICVDVKNYDENEEIDEDDDKIRIEKHNDMIATDENKKRVFLKESSSKTTLDSNDPPGKKKKSILQTLEISGI